MNMNKAILSLLFLPMTIITSARTITGIIVDENAEPMGFASVVVLNDTTFVAATISDDASGAFTFAEVNANRLKISMIGYDDYVAAIPADGACGTIAMTPSATLLGEVVVRDRLPQTRLRGGAMLTKVEGSVLETVGTAEDVLTRLPLLSREQENITVLGHGTPLIYINGRLVRNNNELQQLSSENIRSIEVITNPGSQYDASVRSVIRIRTKRAPGEGFGFELFHNTFFRHYVCGNDALNLHYTEGPLQVFAEGFVYYGRKRSGADMVQTTFADHIYNQSLSERFWTRGAYYSGKFGFDYLIGSHSFGAYYKYEHDHTRANGIFSTTIDCDGNHVDYRTSDISQLNMFVPVNSANAYYNGTIGQLNIDFNTDLFISRNNDHIARDNMSEVEGPSQSTTLNFTAKRLIAEKLVLSHPLWNGQIEFGEEFTHSRLGYDVTNNGLEIPSTTTAIYENAVTGFASLSQQFGPTNVTAGLRYEHLNNRVIENGILAGDGSRVYNDFFPTLSVSTPIKNVNLALSFSGKISRPTYEQLDGSLLYIDQSTYKHGNPMLRSTKAWNFEATAMWRIFYAMASFTHQKDPVYYDCATKADDPTVRVISFKNIGSDNQVMCVLGAQPRLGHWTNNISAVMLYYHYRTTFNGQPMLFNHPLYILQVRSSLELPCGWAFNLNYNLQSAGTYQNVKTRPLNYLEIQVQKHFFNKALTLKLTGTDLTNRGSDNHPTLYAGNIITYCENYNFNRGVTFSLTYRFNAARNKYKGTGAGSDTRNRM